MNRIPGLYYLNRQVGMLLVLLLGVQLEVFASVVHSAPDNICSDRTEQLDVNPDRPAFRLASLDPGTFRSVDFSKVVMPAGNTVLSFRDEHREIAPPLRIRENTFLGYKIHQLQIFLYSIRYNIDPPEAGKNVS